MNGRGERAFLPIGCWLILLVLAVLSLLTMVVSR